MTILNENIAVVDSVDSWKDSIKFASQKLLDNGYIENKYIDKMIESIEKLGFYVVLSDYIAMPHARPEDGVINTGVSFLKINNGIYYGDKLIYLVFVLAAKDSNNHIDIIGELLEIFQDEEKINKLIKSKNIDEIKEILGGKL